MPTTWCVFVSSKVSNISNPNKPNVLISHYNPNNLSILIDEEKERRTEFDRLLSHMCTTDHFDSLGAQGVSLELLQGY